MRSKTSLPHVSALIGRAIKQLDAQKTEVPAELRQAQSLLRHNEQILNVRRARLTAMAKLRAFGFKVLVIAIILPIAAPAIADKAGPGFVAQAMPAGLAVSAVGRALHPRLIEIPPVLLRGRLDQGGNGLFPLSPNTSLHLPPAAPPNSAGGHSGNA